jgi:hypothetical protein
MLLMADVREIFPDKKFSYSGYLDLNSVYGGGGSSGIPDDVPCELELGGTGTEFDEF